MNWKKCLFLVMLFVILFSFSVYGWDTPFTAEVIEIHFNHGGPSDSIDIMENGDSSPISAPEWSNGGLRNKNFAYLRSVAYSGPTVKAKFSSISYTASDTSLTIEAIPLSGTYDWALNATVVPFSSSSSSLGSFTSSSGQLPNAVKKCSIEWIWRVKKKNGYTLPTPISIDTSSHNYYIVYSTPQSPMQIPWVGVLDRACNWASSQTTDSGIVSALTTSLHNSGVEYNPDQHYTYTSDETPPNLNSQFYLSTLLSDMSSNISSVQMDCRDFSNFLGMLSTSLGVDGYFKVLKKDGGRFNYNYIHPAQLDWESQDWGFHQVGWFWNSMVADAAAYMDGYAPPYSQPCQDYPVTGNLSLASYLQLLTQDTSVQGSTTGKLEPERLR